VEPRIKPVWFKYADKTSLCIPIINLLDVK